MSSKVLTATVREGTDVEFPVGIVNGLQVMFEIRGPQKRDCAAAERTVEQLAHRVVDFHVDTEIFDLAKLFATNSAGLIVWFALIL